MSIESIISGLTLSEKLDVFEMLWRDLSRDPSRYPSPDWHQQVLAGRMENPTDGPRLPLAEAIDDVRGRLNARRSQG